ncbi:unnamed protein product [Brachionus calyciflorus]|uniref:Uncharacterized protein n=1 Tax=Brachionus calyciflorus TaxID=104777 RepID=A0A813SVC4_9BILA|nr:unnamed protein product [Brachionus calyciflorus]
MVEDRGEPENLRTITTRNIENVYSCSLVADNTIYDAIGESDKLRICISNSIIYQKYSIMDLDDYDVVIGLDWFLKSGATLTPVEKSLKFPNDTEYYEEHCNKYDHEELNLT